MNKLYRYQITSANKRVYHGPWRPSAEIAENQGRNEMHAICAREPMGCYVQNLARTVVVRALGLADALFVLTLQEMDNG